MAELQIGSPEPKKITLRLLDGQTLIDEVEFEFDRNLDTVIIHSVDNLLKKNRMNMHTMDQVSIDEDIDKNSSLFKILQTFQIALKQ